MSETEGVVIRENFVSDVITNEDDVGQELVQEQQAQQVNDKADKSAKIEESIQANSAVLLQPDPINDDPVDFIDVVATDSPAKLADNNVIRVISAAPPSTIITLDDEDEGKIMEGLRKSREPPKIVRRIFVRRDPNTGGLLVDKNNSANQSIIGKGDALTASKPVTKPNAIAELPTVTDEECVRAAEATKDFAAKLKSLKLTPKQKEAILSYAGSLVDKLITITKESKDREIQQKLEDDRLWLRNEIDSIIEKRLGSVRVNANRQFWRNEAEKFTEMALTNLMVYRENGTRKQDVLTSALAGFNMAYIQTHKYGVEIITTIKKMRDNFVENPRACRAFVDVCAEFLMNNCFEKHFPCNAEKYALLRHCEQIFDIKLDFKFFTLENGTGKLDRRIRTIRTTDYKKGGKIQRKRKPLNRPSLTKKQDLSIGKNDETDGDIKTGTVSTKEDSKSQLNQKRFLQKRTWTRQNEHVTAVSSSSSTSAISTRSMAKRVRLGPVADKKLIILTKKVAEPVEKPNGSMMDVVESKVVMDSVNDVELPKDEE